MPTISLISVVGDGSLDVAGDLPEGEVLSVLFPLDAPFFGEETFLAEVLALTARFFSRWHLENVTVIRSSR